MGLRTAVSRPGVGRTIDRGDSSNVRRVTPSPATAASASVVKARVKTTASDIASQIEVRDEAQRAIVVGV